MAGSIEGLCAKFIETLNIEVVGKQAAFNDCPANHMV